NGSAAGRGTGSPCSGAAAGRWFALRHAGDRRDRLDLLTLGLGQNGRQRFPHRGREEPAVSAEGPDVRELAGVGPTTDRAVTDAEQHRDFAGRQQRVVAPVTVLHRHRLAAETLDETLAGAARVRGLRHFRPPSWFIRGAAAQRGHPCTKRNERANETQRQERTLRPRGKARKGTKLVERGAANRE